MGNNNTPLLILTLVPIFFVIRVFYHILNEKTKNLKSAEKINELKFGDFKAGYNTNGFLYRYINILVIFACFLSIFSKTDIIPIMIITLIMLFVTMLTTNESKVFKFYNDSFTVQKYFPFFCEKQEFYYSDIDKVEYLIAGYGTAQIRVFTKNGIRKKISFKPGFLSQDSKLIKLILKEKVDLDIKQYKWKDVVD